MKTLRYIPVGGTMGEPHLITVGDDVAASLLVNECFTLAGDPPPDETPAGPPEPDTAPVADELPPPPTPEQIVSET